jgi:hypothetical protein
MEHRTFTGFICYPHPVSDVHIGETGVQCAIIYAVRNFNI